MNENIVAKILFIIGIAQIVVGIILGLLFANAEYNYGGWSTFFTWAIGGFVTGMLFIGFSEVIKILHTINEKIAPLKGKSNEIATKNLDINNGMKESTNPVNWSLGEADKEKVHELYVNDKVIEIVPSILEGYCLVKLKNEQSQYVRVVDVGGFRAEEVHDEEVKRTIISWYNHGES